MQFLDTTSDSPSRVNTENKRQYSPGSGWSNEVGITTPAAAASWTYAVDSPMNEYGGAPLGIKGRVKR